jgi:hypothetical protein
MLDTKEREERQKSLPPPKRPPRTPPPQKPDSEVIIAQIRTDGRGKANQEPPEVVEAIPEETRSSWPPPGRAFVSRNFWIDPSS